MDLFFRKIVRNEGGALAYLLGQVRDFAAAEGGNGRLKAERAALAAAADDVEAMTGAMQMFLAAAGEQPAQIYRVGLNTTRLLLALGDLIVGWLLARQAEIAHARLDAAGLARRTRRSRGQGGRGPVLRPGRAAPAGRRAADHRGDHARPDGRRAGRVLTPVPATRRPG